MKKQNSILIAVLIPLVALIAVLVFFLVKKNSTDSDTTSLPIERYMDTPKSFAGNTYSLNATIDSQLGFLENKGRIILLKTSENKSIPIYVLASTEGFSPNVGQKYLFNIRIDQDGKLVMTNFKKL